MTHEEIPMVPVVIVPPDIADPVCSDDEAWERLFAELTGGTEEGIAGSRSRINLQEDVPDSTKRLQQARASVPNQLAPPPQLSPPAISPCPSVSSFRRWSQTSPRLSLKSREPLLQPKDRFIKIEALEQYILGKKSVELEIEYGIPRSHLCRAVKELKKADLNKNGKIEYNEWKAFYSKDLKDAKSLLPAVQWLLYQPTYSCHPPPVVILLFSVIQIACYIYHTVYISSLVQDPSLASQAPTCSYLIYNPTRRYQAWRFLTYQFVHVNTEHIVFNTLMQLVVGLPLEMSQPGSEGTLRVLVVYLAGVLLGSVGGSIPSPSSYLAGASAGVYALIAAHLATLVLNWKEDGAVFEARRRKSKAVSQSLNPLIRLARLLFVITFTLFDVGYILYNHYSGITTNTSHMGHLAGALAGLMVGLVALENRKVEEWEVKLKGVSILLYICLLLAAVLWHLIGTDTGYFPASSHAPSCSYILDSVYRNMNASLDHSHL